MLAGYPLASLAVTGIAAGVLAIGGLYLLACRREERRWRANKP
jgi:nitrate reductase gamma subunit